MRRILIWICLVSNPKPLDVLTGVNFGVRFDFFFDSIQFDSITLSRTSKISVHNNKTGPCWGESILALSVSILFLSVLDDSKRTMSWWQFFKNNQVERIQLARTQLDKVSSFDWCQKGWRTNIEWVSNWGLHGVFIIINFFVHYNFEWTTYRRVFLNLM